MAVIQEMSQAWIDKNLVCPPGQRRVEMVDPQRTGLYIEVVAARTGGVYYVRTRDHGGKLRHYRLGTASEITLAEARKKTNNLKAEILLGKTAKPDAPKEAAVPTLDAYWVDSFYPYIQPRKRSAGKDESLYRLYLKEKFGADKLTDLKRQQVQTYHAELVKDKGLSEASADHVLKLLRSMLNRAVEWDVIAVSPIAHLKLFNPDNRCVDRLDAASLARLLAVLQGDENRGVCNAALFLLATGARLNEALSATWDQIDREHRVWLIPASNSKSKRIRSVPLNDTAIEVLDRLGTEGVVPYLFRSEKTGERLIYVHKVWDRLRTKAACPGLKIHSLRRTFGSMLVDSGVSIYTLQRLLGHQSHTTTERHYAVLSSGALADAANSASTIIQGAMPKAA